MLKYCTRTAVQFNRVCKRFLFVNAKPTDKYPESTPQTSPMGEGRVDVDHKLVGGKGGNDPHDPKRSSYGSNLDKEQEEEFRKRVSASTERANPAGTGGSPGSGEK